MDAEYSHRGVVAASTMTILYLDLTRSYAFIIPSRY